MIYEIAKEIATILAGNHVPYSVVYGPERAPLGLASPRFVIERDRSSAESIVGPRSRARNPVEIVVRQIPCVCRVFAKSTLGGAKGNEHEREADQMVDKAIVAIHRVLRVRNSQYQLPSAQLMSADALKYAGLEQWPGVVYEIKFSVERGVFDTTWTNAAKAEATVGGEGGITFGTTTTASGAGDTNLPGVTTRINE